MRARHGTARYGKQESSKGMVENTKKNRLTSSIPGFVFTLRFVYD
ncbi:hypothetical protein E2C01_100667 [Portunus trituberculatus]|uniref:Uncharacterized protein n=1 Tax=Portunus trituberculatus TaxID=210409 RepID=A0A5B7K3Q2_PORTR|nr:hypothetical protein [Portunus trituberculatus]